MRSAFSLAGAGPVSMMTGSLPTVAIARMRARGFRLCACTYFSLANLKCEPTGALPLGALMLNKDLFAAKKICLVVSGGNVDGAVYAQLLKSN